MKAAGLEHQRTWQAIRRQRMFLKPPLVWTHHGRAPKHREMGAPPSVDPKAMSKIWNVEQGARGILEGVNADSVEVDEVQSGSIESSAEPTGPARACDKREIKLGLRYSVLKRDSFRCVICGRSPATHLGVVLHVDHIIPWSGDRKTILDNLRSLCQEYESRQGIET